jgi:hypothetical protein
MAYQEIPVTSDPPAYTYQIDLDGRSYTLDFHFNARMGRWFMGIGDADGVPLLSAIPLLAGPPIINRFKNPALPPGEFLVFDTTGKSISPGADELGSRVQLLYIPVADL